MKRIIATISVLSLLTMFSFGCTPTDTTKNGVTRNNEVTRDNGITRNNDTFNDEPYNYDGVENNVTDGDGNINNDDDNYRNPALGDTNKVDSIKDVCTRKDNVDDASVAINDDKCYVGLDLENNAKLSESMKEDLSTQIRRTDPSITKVYFTEDRSVIDNFINSVRDTVDVDWNQLQNAFR